MFKLYVTLGGNTVLVLAVLERLSIGTAITYFLASVAFVLFGYLMAVCAFVVTSPNFSFGTRAAAGSLGGVAVASGTFATPLMLIIIAALIYVSGNLTQHYRLSHPKKLPDLAKWSKMNIESPDVKLRDLALRGASVKDPTEARDISKEISSRVDQLNGRTFSERAFRIMSAFSISLINIFLTSTSVFATYNVTTESSIYGAYVLRGASDILTIELVSRDVALLREGEVKGLELCDRASSNARLLNPPLGRSVVLPSCKL